MSLKDNFNQAVKEILKKDALVGNDMSKDEAQKTELDRYLEPSAPTKQKEQPTQQTSRVVEQKPSQENQMHQAAVQNQQPTQNTQQVQQAQAAQTQQQTPPPQPANYNPIESPYSDVEEQTVISRNTIIEGNVRSFANVNVEGSIKGNVQSTKNANVSGKLIGDLDCNNASMIGSQMQGNVSSKGQVKFDRDSLILGNVVAQYLDMNGKVKGNIDINGKAEFKSDAYIIGDINVSTLTVSEGATISGHVNTTYIQESPSSVFPEMIAMTELG